MRDYFLLKPRIITTVGYRYQKYSAKFHRTTNYVCFSFLLNTNTFIFTVSYESSFIKCELPSSSGLSQELEEIPINLSLQETSNSYQMSPKLSSTGNHQIYYNRRVIINEKFELSTETEVVNMQMKILQKLSLLSSEQSEILG